MEGQLVGWGYQGRTPEDLIVAMGVRGATRLVDVRLTPVSRVRGFSKSRLRDRLETAGLVYEHRPGFGNPREKRPEREKTFKNTSPATEEKTRRPRFGGKGQHGSNSPKDRFGRRGDEERPSRKSRIQVFDDSNQ